MGKTGVRNRSPGVISVWVAGEKNHQRRQRAGHPRKRKSGSKRENIRWKVWGGTCVPLVDKVTTISVKQVKVHGEFSVHSEMLFCWCSGGCYMLPIMAVGLVGWSSPAPGVQSSELVPRNT